MTRVLTISGFDLTIDGRLVAINDGSGIRVGIRSAGGGDGDSGVSWGSGTICGASIGVRSIPSGNGSSLLNLSGCNSGFHIVFASGGG